ncbi:MAG: CoA transferase [Dehalococcoidia bacterium]
MTGPLHGIRVLDLTWALAGPYATMLLADLGADVIKLERPPRGDIARENGPFVGDVSTYFFSVNRGKRSIAIDLKTEAGRNIFIALVRHVDVLAENFVPGTMDRLGLGYSVLKDVNPRLIYAATSGFGQTGPYRSRPALDIIVQALSGLMSITGPEGGPAVRVGTSIGDIVAGLFTANGILAALVERDRSGLGQLVDVAMLDGQVAILENALVRYFATGETPHPLGTRHPVTTPFQAFPTADGSIVLSLIGGGENAWERFAALVGRVDLIDDPRFATNALRTAHHADLEPILVAAFSQRTTAEWLADLDAQGIPCAPVQGVDRAAHDPQIAARRMVVALDHPRAGRISVAGSPVKLSRTPSDVSRPAPDLGEHTAEVLAEILGLREGDLTRLRAEGALPTVLTGWTA